MFTKTTHRKTCYLFENLSNKVRLCLGGKPYTFNTMQGFEIAIRGYAQADDTEGLHNTHNFSYYQRLELFPRRYQNGLVWLPQTKKKKT